MKISKKIFISIIVLVVILGLVSFYLPIRAPRAPVPSSRVPENLPASITPITSTSTPLTSEGMPGFSGLDQESKSINEIIDDFSKELNQ